MNDRDDRLIRNISDTARWVAAYRARETERPDPLFRDPFARRLAGERGEQIARSMDFQTPGDWPLVARTLLFDAFVEAEVARGADLVVNLAAGLDARPYRMKLPPALRWVEADLPGILDYKEEALAGEKPACALERVRVDLADVAARRDFFTRLASGARRAVVMSEGLLIYLEADDVGALARDLAAAGPSFDRWIVDLSSPGLMKRLAAVASKHLSAANAPFRFAPAEGPGFFLPHGWRPLDVRSLLKEAGRVKRLPWFLRFFALFPDSSGPQGERPWGGVVLLGRA